MKKNFFGLREYDINLYRLRSPDFYNNMISQRDQIYKKLNKFLTDERKCCCLLCGSKKKKVFFRWKKYYLLKCLNCSSVYTNINFKIFKT